MKAKPAANMANQQRNTLCALMHITGEQYHQYLQQFGARHAQSRSYSAPAYYTNIISQQEYWNWWAGICLQINAAFIHRWADTNIGDYAAAYIELWSDAYNHIYPGHIPRSITNAALNILQQQVQEKNNKRN